MANTPTRRSNSGEIAKFLEKSQALAPRETSDARLIFAIDATASRQATWDKACQLQGEMFRTTQQLGGLSLQLCYYRGIGELRASQWLSDQATLLKLMRSVRCEGGYTQIERLLNHALEQHRDKPVRAMVFIGDACEESIDHLLGKAGEAGMLGLPLFMFQEGRQRAVRDLFKDMARLSGGAYAQFDAGSAQQLANLLGAVARYAASGREGFLKLDNGSSADIKALLEQLR